MKKRSMPIAFGSFMMILCATMNWLSAEEIQPASQTASENQSTTDEQLTPMELVRIEEQRLAEVPEEVMSMLQFYGANKVNFNDEEHLYRIHNDAYYAPVAVSGSGDVIQLNDASKWSVHPYQRKTVLYWVQSDLIFIKPKSSCFSMYNYVLQNRTTQESVEVNLIGSPIPTGAYTHWIVNIDPYKQLIQLNDDTIWQINQKDYAFNKWQIGHRIMVGVNNYWGIAEFPHILINTNLYNAPYSEAEFIGYPAGY